MLTIHRRESGFERRQVAKPLSIGTGKVLLSIIARSRLRKSRANWS
jgi:hypothetical protein